MTLALIVSHTVVVSMENNLALVHASVCRRIGSLVRNHKEKVIDPKET